MYLRTLSRQFHLWEADVVLYQTLEMGLANTKVDKEVGSIG